MGRAINCENWGRNVLKTFIINGFVILGILSYFSFPSWANSTTTEDTKSQNQNELQNLDTIIIKEFEFLGNTAFDSTELATVIADFRNRPLTFSELLQAESAITQYYVEAGYINSGALIPAGQNLATGIVKIQIIEGGIEEIQVQGTGRLHPDYIRSRLALATETPLNVNRLLEALQLLQLNPLIEQISAELAAGVRPELSLLTVTVEPASPWDIQVNLDNGRTPSVGTFRRGVDIAHQNVLGWGDQIAASYINTDGSDDFDLSYTLPINAHNGTLQAAYRGTRSDVIEPPFDQLDITGDSNTYEFTYRQPVQQTPTQEIALGITTSWKDSNTTILGLNEPLSPGADDEGYTRIFALGFFQEWTQRSPQSIFLLRSQFNLGLDAFGATNQSEAPDTQFFAWRGQAQYVHQFAPATLMILRSDIQLATTPLVPLEQFTLGGFQSVRGYRQDRLLTDSGILLSAETQIPIVWFDSDKVLQLTPFIDFGHGWNDSDGINREPLREDTLLGAGVGLQLRLGDQFTGRIEYGFPLMEVESRDRTWQENGIYFSIIYNPF